MLDSVNAIAALATQLSRQNTLQQVNVAVFKKVHDMQVQQAENVLQVLETSSQPAVSIDVYV